VKNLFGAAVIAADVLFGMAGPQTFANLHKETPAHQHGTIAFYAVLAVLTVLVLVSLARAVQGNAQAKAAASAPHPVQTFGPRR
jgi:hypothetical protein